MVTWPNGKALDYESRDCRFDPCRDLFVVLVMCSRVPKVLAFCMEIGSRDAKPGVIPGAILPSVPLRARILFVSPHLNQESGNVFISVPGSITRGVIELCYLDIGHSSGPVILNDYQ